MTAHVITYSKQAGDLLPGHLVQGTGGQRYRVVGNERVRRGVRQLALLDMDTGHVILREMGATFEVKCLEVAR